jgi:hypothetical protein
LFPLIINYLNEKYDIDISIDELDDIFPFGQILDGSAFKSCGSVHHSASTSIYLKHMVPVHEFMENPQDINSKIFIWCKPCRIYRQNLRKKSKTKIKSAEANKSDEKLRCCFSDCHNVKSGSPYPKNKVPCELFQSEDEKITPIEYTCCLHCRIYNTKKHQSRRNTVKTQALENELIICTKCLNEITDENIGYNKNGIANKTCKFCVERVINDAILQRLVYNKIKMEIIYKIGSCCEKCNMIFLKPLNDSLIVIELQTYIKNNNRYVLYNDEEISTSTFIMENQQNLELSILEFDHLTCEEQIERGIISSVDDFKPKHSSVSDIHSEKGQRIEAKKCQLVCSRSHIEETIKRESGSNRASPLTHEKMNYVNNIKKEGCVSCGKKYPDLLRFLEMDHIDPKTKIDAICNMVQQKRYDMNTLIEECKKCRVLCRFCHTIHSHIQRKLENI